MFADNHILVCGAYAALSCSMVLVNIYTMTTLIKTKKISMLTGETDKLHVITCL